MFANKALIMAYLPRYEIINNDATFHVTWQCHNKDWLLKETWAKDLYYQLLLKYKDKYHVQFYSYNLDMDNHPHLSGKLKERELFSTFFKVVNSCFARFYNKAKGRFGQVVMDRFKSPQIETNEALLKVMQYIDLNPKRAGKVKHPKQNRFSSYHYYAFGHEDPLITPAPAYLELGDTDKERQRKYREMIDKILLSEWKIKKDYSITCFIGNPDWVTERYNSLKVAMKKRKEAWKKRSRDKYG